MKKHPELTVIITFLNEGSEVYHTVKNIRETSDIEVNIILINDASTDGYNYKSVSEEFGTHYISHAERKGVAASRDEGIELCSTKYFLLLDAHMRFFQNDWVSILLGILENNPTTLFCCQTVNMEIGENGEVISLKNQTKTYGAYIYFDDNQALVTKWDKTDPDPNEPIVDIACVLGASYTTNKKYWQYLRGLEGLRSYGADEELISLKVWLEGGKCQLIKSITVGHLYRTDMPYATLDTDFLYNRLYIAELFLSKEEKYQVFKSVDKLNTQFYKEAVKLLSENRALLKEQKEYYKQIFKKDIKDVLAQNKFLQNRN
ncbi:glycosyl transferase family 2 [Dysgonomonas alginatilytica]|uniref:Glycosyl transferase family 2 n=1 Tax=Dysgonomonas alginatilytica TaxID=1605892 RepID=A0A2V3PSY6_9BACT|nr:glycosyltransferase [Dysgonomonas alginatilytica]PXV62199.1 glycosyl transferase family 2 [Dysgonomonas alginatilytica]